MKGRHTFCDEVTLQAAVRSLAQCSCEPLNGIDLVFVGFFMPISGVAARPRTPWDHGSLRRYALKSSQYLQSVQDLGSIPTAEPPLWGPCMLQSHLQATSCWLCSFGLPAAAGVALSPLLMGKMGFLT